VSPESTRVKSRDGALNAARYRNYHPTLGRWLQRDPAGYRDGANLYGYVSDNPEGAVDPTGLIQWDSDPEIQAARGKLQSTETGRQTIAEVERMEKESGIPCKVKKATDQGSSAGYAEQGVVRRGVREPPHMYAYINTRDAHPLDAGDDFATEAYGDGPADQRFGRALDDVLCEELRHVIQEYLSRTKCRPKNPPDYRGLLPGLDPNSKEGQDFSDRWGNLGECEANMITNKHKAEKRARGEDNPDRVRHRTTEAQKEWARKKMEEMRQALRQYQQRIIQGPYRPQGPPPVALL